MNQVYLAVNENIITEEKCQPNLPYQFSEEELKQVFEVIDRHKQGYITATEIQFFLRLLDMDA